MELGLLLPIFLLLLAGLLDISRVFSQTGIIANSAREGARYAMLHPGDTSGIDSRVISEAAGSGVTLTDSEIAVIPPTGGTALQQPITVQVTYSTNTIMGGVTGSPTLTISRQCQMPIIGLG